VLTYPLLTAAAIHRSQQMLGRAVKKCELEPKLTAKRPKTDISKSAVHELPCKLNQRAHLRAVDRI
jgi:hypothetical protein